MSFLQAQWWGILGNLRGLEIYRETWGWKKDIIGWHSTFPWSQSYRDVYNPYHCLLRIWTCGNTASKGQEQQVRCKWDLAITNEKTWSPAITTEIYHPKELICKMWDNAISVCFNLIRKYDLTWHLDYINWHFYST